MINNFLWFVTFPHRNLALTFIITHQLLSPVGRTGPCLPDWLIIQRPTSGRAWAARWTGRTPRRWWWPATWAGKGRSTTVTIIITTNIGLTTEMGNVITLDITNTRMMMLGVVNKWSKTFLKLNQKLKNREKVLNFAIIHEVPTQKPIRKYFWKVVFLVISLPI